MKRHRTRGPTGLFSVAALLLVVALALGACAKPAPQGPAATTTDVPKPTELAPTSAPANTPASEAAATSNLPVGVDAEGNFYKGDPKASVKLVEFSDFQ